MHARPAALVREQHAAVPAGELAPLVGVLADPLQLLSNARADAPMAGRVAVAALRRLGDGRGAITDAAEHGRRVWGGGREGLVSQEEGLKAPTPCRRLGLTVAAAAVRAGGTLACART